MLSTRDYALEITAGQSCRRMAHDKHGGFLGLLSDDGIRHVPGGQLGESLPKLWLSCPVHRSVIAIWIAGSNSVKLAIC